MVSPMNRTPISLIIDDPAPRVFVYYEHSTTRKTADGRPLVNEVPNDFLAAFCDVAERWGISGKYSVVPCPGGRGDIVNGITGFAKEEIDWWLKTAAKRLSPYFAFCPEILTHAGAIDLATGKMMDIRENDWSDSQDRTTMTPYIARALTLLKQAGIDATGVTSPWDFGVHVEDEYAHAISDAMFEVWGRTDVWYFCRSLYDIPGAKPWIPINENGRRVVAMPGTIPDMMWKAMDTTDTSEEYVLKVADEYITADGSDGKIVKMLASGGIPILTTHWQSLFSNGARTGLRILNEIGRRVNENLSDKVVWTHFDLLMKQVLDGEV